jgi:iron(III) transport system substrate-binding protein
MSGSGPISLAALGAVVVLFALGVGGCGEPARPELWIYTSVYREVIDRIAPRVQAALPEVALRWYKAGSEEVAARVTAELAAGACRADVLMTADVFWYENLAQEGHLARLPDDVIKPIPTRFRDPNGHYVTNRTATMVLTVNERVVPRATAPRSFAELAEPRWRGKVVIGDPLKSGTSFVTVATLSKKYGWEYYRRLRANDTMVEGGNSAVLRRVELGERPVGVILMENLLKAAKGRSPAVMIVPDDGAIVIPCPIAILARSRRPDDARRFCLWMNGRPGQEAMAGGWMYPVVAGIAGPAGSPEFEKLLASALCPDAPLIREVAGSAEEIKETFVRVMFE